MLILCKLKHVEIPNVILLYNIYGRTLCILVVELCESFKILTCVDITRVVIPTFINLFIYSFISFILLLIH
jgi:hypothetical protein